MLQSDAHFDIPSPYYRVSLKAIIFDKDQRLLVIQTQDGFWELPGGGWEHGESMQHCIRRELMEELCLGVTHINFKQIYPYSSPGRTGHHRLKLAVPVSVQDFDVRINDPDVKAFRFITPQELAALDMVDSEDGIKRHIPRLWPDMKPNA